MTSTSIPMATQRIIYAHISLIFCNIVWACDYPFYSLVLGKYISPMAMVTASLIIAAVLSLVPLLWEKYERVEPRDRLKIIGAALLMGVGRKLCMMFGLAETSAIDGSIIGTTTPLIVLLLSVVVGVEHLTFKKVIGLLLGMGGTLAIILASNSDSHPTSDAWGNLLILSSSIVSAAYMVLCKRLVGKYQVVTVLRWIYCTSAIVMLPIGFDDITHIDISVMDHTILLASLFVLIVPTYLPNLLLNFSLRRLAPTASSIYSYLQPIVAIALSVAMGLDKLRSDTIIFAVIIFLGLGLVVSSYNQKVKS